LPEGNHINTKLPRSPAALTRAMISISVCSNLVRAP
jgi:hypothetical protein